MIKIISPRALNDIIGKEVVIKKTISNVSNGTYYGCYLEDELIGMCSPDTTIEKDEVIGNIISSEVIFGNTKMFLEVK